MWDYILLQCIIFSGSKYTYPEKNGISSYSVDGHIKHYARVHYVGSGDYHLIKLHPVLWEPN